MDIKSGLVGAGAVVLLAGGLFGAAAYANSQDEPAPVVTVAPTIEAEKVAAPVVVVPEPVVTPDPVVTTPAPEVVVPEPEPAVPSPPVVEPPAPGPSDVPAPPHDLDLGSPPPPLQGGLPGSNG